MSEKHIDILTVDLSYEEKMALLRKRLADEKIRLETKKKAKYRREDAAGHKRRYHKKKKKKEKSDLAKKKKELKKLQPTWRIIVTSLKKVLVDVTWTHNKDEAIQKFNKILIENKKDVKYPRKVMVMEHNVFEANYELVLLKKKMNDEKPETLLRNDLGQFVPNVASSEKWVIYQKEPFYFEETFWVYGFHPRHQRKEFKYILNEILLKEVDDVKYPQKRVSVFKNKLVIDDDNYDFNLIICKNQNECIRLYNELEKEIKSLNLKSIFWSGFVKDINARRLVERIGEKTGWDNRKINRSSTRP